METHLLDSILQVWSGECQVLESTDNGPVEWSVGRRRTIQSRDLGLGVDRSNSRMTVEYTGALE